MQSNLDLTSIPAQSVFICMPGEPVGKGRAKAVSMGGFIRMYTPKKTVEYEDMVREEARITMKAGRYEAFSGPVELKLQIFLPIPISYTKRKKEEARAQLMVPTKKPDFDNVVKAVCDAFNGIVWNDDTQVVDCHITKRFGEEPCVIAIITALNLKSC